MMVSNALRSQCELRLLNCFVSRVLRTQQGISAQIYLERNSITPVGSLRSSGGLPEPRRMSQSIIILRNTGTIPVMGSRGIYGLLRHLPLVFRASRCRPTAGCRESQLED